METLHHRLDELSPPKIEGSSDRIQVRIADKLHQTADRLFGKTEDNQTPGEAAKFGTQANTWLHNSADYIEQMEPKKIKEDLTEQVRRNPGKSLLVAGAAGLILAAIFRRK